MVKPGQGFQNTQPGSFPKIVHLSRFAMLNGQPAIARQALKHFSQRGAGNANQFGELTLCRQDRTRSKTIIPDTFNNILFSETRRALRFNDHSVLFPLRSGLQNFSSSYQTPQASPSLATGEKAIVCKNQRFFSGNRWRFIGFFFRFGFESLKLHFFANGFILSHFPA